VKPLNLKIANLVVIPMLFFSLNCISQNIQSIANDTMETFNASGDDATGDFGSVTYSIGQVFYTQIGEFNYNVTQGIQQQELNQTLAVEENSVEPKTEIFIFPNPTTDYVIVNTEGVEFESGQDSYQLYDIQGRLVKQNIINQNETKIDLNDLSPSLYLLQVYTNNRILKTFKIIKQ
jgi:hypothetical protein